MKKILSALLVLAVALLCGCTAVGGDPEAEATERPALTAKVFESREEAFAMYDEVTFEDTLETLTERYGEPRVETDENGDAYYWNNDTCGIVAVFFDNGRLRSKLVYFEDFRQFSAISDAKSVDGVLSLNADFTLQTVNAVLGGEGVEFIRVAQDSSVNPAFSIGYLWVDDQQQEVKILFNKNGKIDNISYDLK